MQVVKESLSPCQVSLQIEVESDKVAKAVDQAYRDFSKHIAVPGFRRGKAPLSFVKPRVPDEQLRERTVEILVEPAYREALEKEELKPFGNPQLELVSLETAPAPQFTFKALIPLPPQVELGQYKGLSAERLRYAITDETVAERIQQGRVQGAEYTKVDRPAAKGDILVVDLTITPEGASEPGPLRSTAIEIGEKDNIAGLDDHLIGLSAGDDKAFQLTYPDDYPEEEVAGRTAGFFVMVTEVQERKLPELDDDFAKSQGADSVGDLRAKVTARMTESMDEMSLNLLETQLVDQVVNSSKIDFPQFMMDGEIEGDVKELLEQLKRSETPIEDYLERRGMTQEQLIEEMGAKADVRIRRGLVIGKIASAESLQVVDADIEAEIAERAAKQGATPEIMRAYMESTQQMDRMAQSLVAKKVLGFIVGSAIITDRTLSPDEPIDGAAKPAKAAKASKPKAAKTADAAAAAEEPEKPKRTRKPKAE